MRVTKVMGKKSKDTNQTRSGIALNTFEIYESDNVTWVEKYWAHLKMLQDMNTVLVVKQVEI